MAGARLWKIRAKILNEMLSKENTTVLIFRGLYANENRILAANISSYLYVQCSLLEYFHSMLHSQEPSQLL